MGYLWVINIILAVCVAAAVAYILMSNRRERKIKEDGDKQNRRLVNILTSGNVTLWTYDTLKKEFTMYDNDLSSFTETFEEMQERMEPTDFENLMSCVAKVAQGLSEKEVFLQQVSKRYGGKQAELTVTPLNKNFSGQATALLVIQHDITQEQKQRVEDERAMKMYQSIFDGSFFDVFIFDKEGFLVDLNQHACDTLGVNDPQKIISEKPNIKNVEVMREVVFQDLESHSMVTKIEYFEGMDKLKILPVVKPGQKKYYETALIPIFDDKGEFVYLCMRGFDITEVVEGFHGIRKYSQSLQDATEKISDVINNADHVLSSIDCKLSVFDPINRRQYFYHTIDVPTMELDEIEIFYTIQPESYRVVMDNILKAIKRVDERLTFPMHSNYKNDDGSERWLKMIFNPSYDEKGNVVKYVGALYNDSQLIATTNKLTEERQKALEAETVKSSFLKNMSYEIRTPLNTIVGFSDLLGSAHSEEDEKVFVAEIKKNSDMLLRLISNVILISRLDSNMVQIKKQLCDMTVEFNKMCHDAWDKTGNTQVPLIVESPYESLEVQIDETHMQMIVDKIIENAAQYTKEGSVHCRMEYVGGAITFTFEDTGCGIPEDKLPVIMERFVRVADDDNNGSGLGLPICKAMAELMGGTVGISSTLGKGTQVWVTIPCLVSEMKRKKIVYVEE